jgi:hypothetical protein
MSHFGTGQTLAEVPHSGRKPTFTRSRLKAVPDPLQTFNLPVSWSRELAPKGTAS